MSAGNGDRHGDTTPPDAQALGDLSERDQLALLRECVHGIGALREDMGVQLEYAKTNHAATKALGAKVDGLAMQHASDTGQIMGELGRIAKNLGMVERRQSRPDEYAARIADLHLEGEITRMTRIKAEGAHKDRERALSLQRSVDFWSGVRRVARLAVAAAIVVAPIVWIALKGWIE